MAFSDEEVIRNQLLPYLAPRINRIISNLPSKYFHELEEIRLRFGQPLLIKVGEKDVAIDARGNVSEKLERGYRIDDEDLYRTIASISDNSLYAYEEEIRRGFITLPGGHRVGLAGQVMMNGNQVGNIKSFSGIAFRVAREVKDCARQLMPYICKKSFSNPLNTILISPPRCGKTTILRDIARILSDGNRSADGCNVSIIDERSELAGCYRGIPQLDVGQRTDVLDSCPKALGMIMAIRSLSPRVVITDEIGRKEDVDAIRECVNAGVAVITSIHAGSVQELGKRPIFQELLMAGSFKLGVVLSRRRGPGSVEEIIRWDE
ncbi:MAG: stage III sporulation protein AA [Syntrophomonas sp.]